MVPVEIFETSFGRHVYLHMRETQMLGPQRVDAMSDKASRGSFCSYFPFRQLSVAGCES